MQKYILHNSNYYNDNIMLKFMLLYNAGAQEGNKKRYYLLLPVIFYKVKYTCIGIYKNITIASCNMAWI